MFAAFDPPDELAQHKILIKMSDLKKLFLLHQHLADSIEKGDRVVVDAPLGQVDEKLLELELIQGQKIFAVEVDEILEGFLSFQEGFVQDENQIACKAFGGVYS